MKMYLVAVLSAAAALACAQGPFNGGAISQSARDTQNATAHKHFLGITGTSLSLQWAQYSDTVASNGFQVDWSRKVPATSSVLGSVDFSMGPDWGFGGWVSGHHGSFAALSEDGDVDTFTTRATFYEIHITKYIRLSDPSSSLSVNVGYESAQWTDTKVADAVNLGTLTIDMLPVYGTYSTAVGDRPDGPLRVGATAGILPMLNGRSALLSIRPTSYITSANVSYRLSKNIDLVACGYKQAFANAGTIERVTVGLGYRF